MSSIRDMLILTNTTITPSGDAGALLLEDEDANGRYRVVQVGDSVTITTRNELGRHVRVDQIREAEVSGPKGRSNTYTVEGISTKLVDTVQLRADEARVTFTMEGTDGCPSCH